jgi:CRP-like cAMP-binding protein
MQTLEDLIAASPVFAALTPAQLRVVAGCGRNERVDAGTALFSEGERADRFWFIRKGSVALAMEVPGRGPLTLQTLHEGEVVGWSWLFEPYRWQFDARVLEPTAFVTFDGACLRGKCEADHGLGYELMRAFSISLVERLQATRFQLLDVYGHGRVA